MVLFETVTGKRLFDGKTVSDTLAAVLKEEPDLNLAPGKTRRLLRACLEKDPKRRLRDIGDMGRLLDTEPSTAAPLQPRLSKAGWIAAAVLVVLLTALAFVHFREIPPTERALYSSISIPEKTSPGFLALSPDGRSLVVMLAAEGLKVMVAAVRPGRESAPEIGVPQELFQFRGTVVVPLLNMFAYSPAAGGRFLVNTSANTGEPIINLITNWQKLAPSAKAP